MACFKLHNFGYRIFVVLFFFLAVGRQS